MLSLKWEADSKPLQQIRILKAITTVCFSGTFACFECKMCIEYLQNKLSLGRRWESP